MTEPNGDPPPENTADGELSGTNKIQVAQDHLITTIAEESIARDLREDLGEDDSQKLDRRTSEQTQYPHEHSLTTTFHRPSFAGNPRPLFSAQAAEFHAPSDYEREDAIRAERSLLRDNQIIPPKHPRSQSVASRASSRRPSGRRVRPRISVPGFHIPRLAHGESVDEDAIDAASTINEPTESTALLAESRSNLLRDPEAPYGGEDDPENIDQKWEEAVMSGRIKTSWQRETKVLFKYAAPGVLTFFLQNSLTMTSIFTVGHIGKIQLGAVSLGSMTANITGYAIYHGLTTSLDTLCAQAYGSGKKQLVGLQLQRMVYFLWLITIPIAVVWLFGSQILAAIIPEKEIAELSGQYLKVLVLGAPAYALFESAKRYVQAQGRFEATTYVLLICAPINVLLHWLFVWVSIHIKLLVSC